MAWLSVGGVERVEAWTLSILGREPMVVGCWEGTDDCDCGVGKRHRLICGAGRFSSVRAPL